MGIELSAEDKAGLTEAEIEALSGDNTEALLATYGDNPVPEATPAAGAAPNGEEDPPQPDDDPDPDDTPAEPAPKDEPKAAAPATAEPKAAAPSAPTAEELADELDDDFALPKLPDPIDLKAEKAKMRQATEAIEAKWSAGELSDEERAAQIAQAEDDYEAKLITHAKVEGQREAAAQRVQAVWDQALRNTAAAAKKAGTVDYAADAAAAADFDAFLASLQKVPENAKLKPAQLVVEAHKRVLAVRGLVEKRDPTPTEEPKPARRANTPTATLSGVPSAAPKGMEVDVLEKFATLEGEEAEEYFASLPPAQQQAITRAADATAMQHTGAVRSNRRQTDRVA